MGIPLNSTLQISIVGTLFGQRILTVLRGYVSVIDEATTIVEDLTAISDFVGDTAVGTFLNKLLACQTEDYTCSEVRAQVTYPTRSIYVAKTVDETGTAEGTCDTGNIAAVLTKRSYLAGRKGIGAIHIAGIVTSDVAAGIVTGDLRTKMRLAGEVMYGTQVIPGSTLRFLYCTASGASAPNSPIYNVVAQDTARVMRRRTVRVGE